jgi:hypothetical protein
MTRRSWRVAAVVTLLMAGGATALAQRGGFGFGWSPASSANVPYDGRFVFVRMSYDNGAGLGQFGRRGRGEAFWAHDYPVGERNFLEILTMVSNVPAHADASNVMSFDDPEIFKFPVLYLVEPGYWYMTDEQVVMLRSYLTKGGFLIVDDFPDWAWPNFELQMSRVFPEGRWVEMNELPGHPVFHTFFELDPATIPVAYNLGGQPLFRALFADNDPAGRMQVIANYQNDLSEYWESSDNPMVPIDESNEAYKFGVNEFIFGLTH